MQLKWKSLDILSNVILTLKTLQMRSYNGVTSATLPSVPSKCHHQSYSRYLSVPFLNPVVRLIIFHANSSVVGPSRGGHVGRFAASVASPTAAFASWVVREGQLANRTGYRQGEKKIDKHARRGALCLLYNPSETCCWRWVAVVSIYRGSLTCEYGLSCSRWGTTERTRPEPMSVHSLCLRSAPVCAPRIWMGFNQTICWVGGPTALFFLVLVLTVCTLIQLGKMYWHVYAE